MTIGTILWKSVILTSVALLLRDIAGIGSAPQNDGDLLYTTSALWTAAHHKIPLLIIVMNNRSYGLVKMLSSNIAVHRKRGINMSHVGNTFENPMINFPELAKGFGVAAFKTIKTGDELSTILPKAISQVKERQEPVLVDIRLI